MEQEQQRRLLVVLDLNGVLLDSTHRARAHVKHDCKARFKYVYFRPGMKDFLDWLFSMPGQVCVGVWTSNIRPNALVLVGEAFSSEQVERLQFVMSREHCDLGPRFTSFKNLQKIWDLGWPADRVVIVDDSVEKIRPSNTGAHCCVPEFLASPQSLQQDNGLDMVKQFVERALDRNRNGLPAAEASASKH